MCWLISNLELVTEVYRKEFIQAFKNIFSDMPKELEAFQIHSAHMRDEFLKMGRKPLVLDQDGKVFQIDPEKEILQRLDYKQLPKFGPYGIVADMPFPDELE